MIERKEVEALYQEARECGGSIGHVDSTHLAALCRAWLAVQDSPKVKVRGKVGEVCMVPVSHDFCGQRVRIVKEPVE